MPGGTAQGAAAADRLTWHGLLYSRTGAPPKPPRLHVRPLYGRWYSFYESPF